MLPADPQEPYLQIVAPNLDKVSAASFDSTTVRGRRARRGLIVAAVAVGGCAGIAGAGILTQWLASSGN